MNATVISSYFLIGFKVHSADGNSSWYHKLVTNLQLEGHRPWRTCYPGEPSMSILLGGHRIELPSEYFSLYPQISEIRFFIREVGGRAQRLTTGTEESTSHHSPKWGVPTLHPLSLKSQGAIFKGGVERL